MPRRILRRCVVCRRVDDRQEFLRIVRKKDGEIVFDPDFREFGRSAYMCKRRECIEKAFRKRKLEKSLRVDSIDREIKERLKKQMLIYIKEVKNEKTKSI